MREDNIKQNSLRAWVLAARPKTLSGAAVPVMIGSALAYNQAGGSSFHLLPCILCFLFAFLMQIDSNFINDYFDFVRGNDDPATRLGPRRACSEGWITPSAMRIGLVVTSLAACAVGAPLIYYGGWTMIIVGLCCVAFAFLYTTFFASRGLGDLLVLVFFGIVPVCFTCYVILPRGMQTISTATLVLSVACGFVIDTLLCINNYRDRDNDRTDGKMTLIVRLGEHWGSRLYYIMGTLGALVTIFACIFLLPGEITTLKWVPIVLFMYFYSTLHDKAHKRMLAIGHGRELNKVLGLTARNMFVYGLLTAINIALG